MLSVVVPTLPPSSLPQRSPASAPWSLHWRTQHFPCSDVVGPIDCVKSCRYIFCFGIFWEMKIFIHATTRKPFWFPDHDALVSSSFNLILLFVRSPLLHFAAAAPWSCGGIISALYCSHTVLRWSCFPARVFVMAAFFVVRFCRADALVRLYGLRRATRRKNALLPTRKLPPPLILYLLRAFRDNGRRTPEGRVVGDRDLGEL